MGNPVQKIGDYIYRVESDKDASKKYVVDLTPEDPPTCTCVAWVMKRNKTGTGDCKHIRYAIEYSVEATRQEITEKEQEAQFDAAKAGLLATLSDLS